MKAKSFPDLHAAKRRPHVQLEPAQTLMLLLGFVTEASELTSVSHQPYMHNMEDMTSCQDVCMHLPLTF